MDNLSTVICILVNHDEPINQTDTDNI